MPLGARRTCRLAGVVAVATAAGYSSGMPLPYLAPLLGFMLTANPSPPPGLKGLLGLVVAVAATLSIGLLMIPVLLNYPLSAVLIIAVGLYLSTIISLEKGKGPVGVLLAVGLTMIPAAGMIDYGLATAVIQALLLGIGIAVVSQWLVYPWFPEDAVSNAPVPALPAEQARWLAARATLIVLLPVMFAFTNPSLYLATILKSLFLAQQGSEINARVAGRELLSSTFVAGCCAVLFWFALQLSPTLWFFTLWMLLFTGYGAAKFYGVLLSRYTPSFWQNVVVTMLILLGPAVEDSANGKDVYQAFAERLALFLAVTMYAWLAIALLEWIRLRSQRRIKNLGNA